MDKNTFVSLLDNPRVSDFLTPVEISDALLTLCCDGDNDDRVIELAVPVSELFVDALSADGEKADRLRDLYFVLADIAHRLHDHAI